MLVAGLLDAYVDRLFAASRDEDIIEFRAGMAAGSRAVADVMALCSGRAILVTEAVAVPIADYGALGVEDFMVSLYNDHTVQRLRLVTADGGQHDVMETLDQAMAAIDQAPAR